jgi:hypothetical protein
VGVTFIPFLLRSELKKLHLRSRIREKAVEFEYGAWAQYRMEFQTSSGRELKGQMVLVETGGHPNIVLQPTAAERSSSRRSTAIQSSH